MTKLLSFLFIMIQADNERWMMRCIQLARNAEGCTAPNPMVGAVIVHGGRIIGEGYHLRAGQAHAEVNAIASVKNQALLRESTLYVNLEPCSHYGKTPPCADLIVNRHIPHVVVGCVDPFAQVQGRGISKLREAGIDVTVGVLEKECMRLNRHFFTFHQKKRPFITLKWAQTGDGFIGPAARDGGRVLISTPHTLIEVHKLRSRHQAILVGRHTAELDNPRLNVRFWSGTDPLRVVIDSRGVLSPNLNLFDGTQPTLVVCEEGCEKPPRRNVDYYHPNFASSIPAQLAAELYRRNVQSLLVEGGRELLQGFIDAGLWDDIVVEMGTQTLGQGVAAPILPQRPVTRRRAWGTEYLLLHH